MKKIKRVIKNVGNVDNFSCVLILRNGAIKQNLIQLYHMGEVKESVLLFTCKTLWNVSSHFVAEFCWQITWISLTKQTYFHFQRCGYFGIGQTNFPCYI